LEADRTAIRVALGGESYTAEVEIGKHLSLDEIVPPGEDDGLESATKASVRRR
jgi:hypothetical protein